LTHGVRVGRIDAFLLANVAAKLATEATEQENDEDDNEDGSEQIPQMA
jgi:hypothetical protein